MSRVYSGEQSLSARGASKSGLRAKDAYAPAMTQADAYFFDIDGTLLVTRDLVHWNALHQAMLEVYGVDTNIDGLPYHGKTDVAILRAALNRCGISDETFNGKLPSALAVVCREVAANVAGISPCVCPAIPDVLGQIREHRKLLGVASGNLESVGWHKVSAAGLREFFSLGSFGDHQEQRAAIFHHAVTLAKDQLGSAVRVCFVGDTPDDIRAARLVDAQIIAVSTGTFGFDELAALHPDHCCNSCAELLGRI
jgi:phosphoglycolate phosphatase